MSEPAPGISAMNESDTNADTCCLGTNFIVLEFTQRTADVYPYDSSYTPVTNVPIVTGATAWTDPSNDTTYILVFHEGLYYGTKLDHTLINPNQVRAHGIPYWDNPFDRTRGLCIDIDDGPMIELNLTGTKLKFESRVPTTNELSSCAHIEMTSPHQWNPESVHLGSTSTTSRQPQVRQLSSIHISENPYTTITHTIYEYANHASDEATLHNIDETLLMTNDYRQISGAQARGGDDIPARRTYTSTQRHSAVTSQSLSEHWGIGIKRAQATLDATTQRGTRSAILPISRRYRADRMYRVKRLEGKFSTDTLYADIKSLKQNIYAQVFSHKAGLAVCYPLTRANGESIGNALLDFIHDFGAPRHLTFDGATVQVGRNTKFMKTIRDYQIQYHVSGPRRPNENPAESMIREIKRRWYRIMTRKRVPPRVWDFGLIWICETQSLTASSSR